MHAARAVAVKVDDSPHGETGKVESLLFLIVVGLWIGFGGLTIVHPDSLSQLWTDIGRLPLAVRVPAGLLFLPWITALAVMDAQLEPWLRDSIVVGLAWMSIHFCFPRRQRRLLPRRHAHPRPS